MAIIKWYHKMVSSKQRRSTLIYPKCKAHLRKTCKYQCKDCNDTYFWSSCTASEQHRHNKIDNVIYEMKTEINEIKRKHKDILQNTFGWSKRGTVYHLANITGLKGNREIHWRIANYWIQFNCPNVQQTSSQNLRSNANI